MAHIAELIEALQIIKKYEPEASVAGADHDIIYLGGDPEKISPEDTKRLDVLGCHVQDGCWCRFV